MFAVPHPQHGCDFHRDTLNHLDISPVRGQTAYFVLVNGVPRCSVILAVAWSGKLLLLCLQIHCPDVTTSLQHLCLRSLCLRDGYILSRHVSSRGLTTRSSLDDL